MYCLVLVSDLGEVLTVKAKQLWDSVVQIVHAWKAQLENERARSTLKKKTNKVCKQSILIKAVISAHGNDDVIHNTWERLRKGKARSVIGKEWVCHTYQASHADEGKWM